jgi:hypothetical protein
MCSETLTPFLLFLIEISMFQDDDMCLQCYVNMVDWSYLRMVSYHAFSQSFVLICRIGMSWVMPRRVIDLLACWWSSDSSRSAAVWKMAPVCIFWCLWWKRNNRNFEDLERSLEEILSLLDHSLYCWTSAYVNPLYISFFDFLTHFSISR